jgi:NTE family protein
VASDIEARKPVVLGKGQLGTAIRASMTIPFYFKPLEMDGKVLFDGGMYNNFPSDIAIDAFQPDVIIGSKAAGNYDKPDPDDIISQVQNMLVARTDYDIVLESGVLIEHELGDIRVMDFSRTREFIDTGYANAMERMDEIKNLIKKRTSVAERKKMRDDFNAQKPPVVIDSLEITGLTRGQTNYVHNMLKRKTALFTVSDIEEEYFEMVADDKIEHIYPQLVYKESTGYYTLQLQMKPAERFQVQFGGNVSSTTANAAFLGVKYKYLGAQAVELGGNVYFGRFYSSAMAKTRIDFPSKPETYLEGGFIYNNKNYFRSTSYFLEDITPAYLIDNESFFYLDLGIPVTLHGRLVGGAALARTKYNYYQTNNFSRLDTADITYFDFYEPRILFELNSLNYKQYPNRGAQLLISSAYVNGIEKNLPGSTSAQSGEYERRHQWVQLKLLYDNYFQRLGPATFGFYGEVLWSNQKLFNNYTSTIMASPAFEPIPESKVLFLPNYRAHAFVAAGLKVITRIHRRIDFRLEGYIFQPYEQIVQNEDLSVSYGKPFSDRAYMGTGVLVWHSPLGPVSISANYYDKAVDQFTFFFNVGYVIFNRSAIE